MRECTLQAAVLILLVAATSEPSAPARDEPPGTLKVSEKVKKDFGARAIDILSGATRVEVFQLKAEPGRKAGPATLGSEQRQWTIGATGKEKGKDFVAKVRECLLDGKTETIGWEPELDRADVALRLWKDKESVAVVIDFRSGHFTVVARDSAGLRIKVAGGSCIYNAKREFDEKGELFARVKALAVEAFPDDEKIKALKQPKEPEEEIRPPVGDKVPEHLLTLLEKADQFELLSLNPQRSKEKAADDFHGYKVLGKTTVKDAEVRKKLVAALKKGVEDNDGAAAGCFNPRHGIRATRDGKTAEFVICFECLFVQVFVGDKLEKGLRTTNSPKDTFDGVLKEAKVPLPEK
jgi:hypothetical protein